MAGRPARDHARYARRRAHQLGVVLLRLVLGLGRGHRPVLPAPVLPQAARPELGEPRGPAGRLRHDAVVAGPRRGRLPDGRHRHDQQGHVAAGHRAPPGLALRVRRPVLHLRPAQPRVPPGDVPGGLRGPRRARAHRGRDAGRHHPAGPAVHRAVPARAGHGLPVRARRPGSRRAPLRPAPAAPARAEGLAGLLAGRAGRARLELAVLGQSRPAPLAVPVRRRRPAPGRLGQDAGHRAAPAPGHAVRLPGR